MKNLKSFLSYLPPFTLIILCIYSLFSILFYVYKGQIFEKDMSPLLERARHLDMNLSNLDDKLNTVALSPEEIVEIRDQIKKMNFEMSAVQDRMDSLEYKRGSDNLLAFW